MKNALITGASSGIGLALANELARRGYRVALAARRTDLLEQEAGRLNREGRAAMALTCDVTAAESVRSAVNIVEKTWGPLDLAVANAGVGTPTPVVSLDLADVEDIMRINFMGMVHLFQAVVPGMAARNAGRFAGVASLAGLRGLPTSAAYSASKAAMQAFLEAARVEMHGTRVGVTIINPGFVISEMTDKNDYPMPFLMRTDRAAKIIARGLERGAREIDFPLPTALGMRLARLMPNALYDRVAKLGAATKGKVPAKVRTR